VWVVRRGLLIFLFLALAPMGWAASAGFDRGTSWLQETIWTDTTGPEPTTTTDTTTTTPTTTEPPPTTTTTPADTTPPTLSGIPGNITESTESPSGKVVTWSPPPTANDNVDGPVPVTCTPDSGATFPIGTTPVTCSASDSAGNEAQQTFTVAITLVDLTAPAVFVPGPITAEATGPGGAAATFAVTAADLIDPSPTVSCNRSSGETFPIGNTTVSCTAKDASNNSSQPATFVVSVVDTTGPSFSSVPAHATVEANGPAGSTVNFATPLAVDLVDGIIGNVSCSPASGSTFALGTHAVTCSASDSKNNTGVAIFNVTVADTTPPTLVIPGAVGVHATEADGIPRTNPVIQGFLNSASAADIVDSSPVVTNNAPAFLPIGTTDVTFTARDASGNGTSRSAAIVVLPKPPPGTPPLPVPPAPKLPDNPRTVNVTTGDGTITLVWAGVAGAKLYHVYRSETAAPHFAAVVHGQLVYSGTARTFTDRGLQNGVEYRYVVVVEDAAGNQSAGVAVVVVPRRNLLRSPKDGARLRKPPLLVWSADAEADYYNAQLLRGGVKILSVWPTRARFQLKKSWRYLGKKYALRPGLYTWYVWPGYGARTAVDYGELMGSRTFRIVR
jgi:hypothetical protein